MKRSPICLNEPKLLLKASVCSLGILFFPFVFGLEPSSVERGLYINGPPGGIAHSNANIACDISLGSDNCGTQGIDGSTGYRWYNKLWIIAENREVYSSSWQCTSIDGSEPYETNIGYCKEQRFVYDTSKNKCDSGSVFSPINGECVKGSKDEGSTCSSSVGGGTKLLGNPINVAVGNKIQVARDLVTNGPFPLSVIRTYNSLSGAWRFFMSVRISADYKTAMVTRKNGKGYLFTTDGAGGWVTDPDVTGTLESTDDGLGNIAGWRYTLLDQTVEEYDAAGRLLAVSDHRGMSHFYSYTAADIAVAHNNGGVLVYQLDSSGRVSGFTSPDGKTYSYSYDEVGNLSSITYPDSGGTRTYHYEDVDFPDALTGVTDANGDRFATWTYDGNGRAISSEHNGGAEKVSIDYTYIDDVTDSRAISTNALGKETTYHFVAINGVQKVSQVEGHASTNCLAANKNYTYDAGGFITSKTDWQGNTTTFIRNTRGQELSRTEASGTPDALTVSTDWHSTFNLRTKVTEPGRETVYTYDANGLLLNQQTTDLSMP
jgi:YD repeat-containing protein